MNKLTTTPLPYQITTVDEKNPIFAWLTENSDSIYWKILYVFIFFFLITYCIYRQLTKLRCREDPNTVVVNDALNSTELLPESELEKYGILRFSKDSLGFVKNIGKGNFATIDLYKVLDQSIVKEEHVAVKEINKSKSADIREIKIINQCKHANIVECFGCYETKQSIFIIMEYLSGGDLHDYLIDSKNEFNLGQAFDMIMQVVTGMCYLSSQRIIHRDLAARNCMLSADRKVIKINDFGLGRKLIIKTYYSQNSNTELPVCWTALECLMGGAFTSKSDIWSCGILMWEILSRQRHPYSDIQSLDELKQFLLNKGRLKRPRECCSPQVYKLMCSCWHEIPAKRPTFRELKMKLEILMDEMAKNTGNEEGKKLEMNENGYLKDLGSDFGAVEKFKFFFQIH